MHPDTLPRAECDRPSNSLSVVAQLPQDERPIAYLRENDSLWPCGIINDTLVRSSDGLVTRAAVIPDESLKDSGKATRASVPPAVQTPHLELLAQVRVVVHMIIRIRMSLSVYVHVQYSNDGRDSFSCSNLLLIQHCLLFKGNGNQFAHANRDGARPQASDPSVTRVSGIGSPGQLLKCISIIGQSCTSHATRIESGNTVGQEMQQLLRRLR